MQKYHRIEPQVPLTASVDDSESLESAPIDMENRHADYPATDSKDRPGRHNGDPFISVVVATFNAVATLDRCVQSVSQQTYRYRELIVIDGGSYDGRVEVLRASAGKIAYWVSEPDRSIYHAWNKALRQSHGDWVCFL